MLTVSKLSSEDLWGNGSLSHSSRKFDKAMPRRQATINRQIKRGKRGLVQITGLIHLPDNLNHSLTNRKRLLRCMYCMI